MHFDSVEYFAIFTTPPDESGNQFTLHRCPFEPFSSSPVVN